MFETLLTVFLVAWVLGVAVWIIMERRTLMATFGWVVLLSFLPYVGIPIYLSFGPRKWHRRRLELARARERMGADLRAVVAEATRDVLDALPPDAARLLRVSAGLRLAAGARAKEIEIYHEGLDFYAALEEAIARARHHVHLEFYIWETGRIGTRLRDALAERARAGVEVRLLVDGVGSARFDESFAGPLIEAGAEVVRFNRPRWVRRPSRFLNFRTHRKIVIVDSATAFTGGMNVVDYHTSEFAGASAQRDTQVRLEGMPASWLQLVFLEDWYLATGGGPNHRDYLCLDYAPDGQLVQVAASGPDTEYAPIHKLFVEAIHGARERLYIHSPYFLPDQALVAALQSAALRGVDVRVMVPAECNHRVVQLASETYYDALLGCGVKIYQYEPRMHHAKVLVADRAVGIVGSANLDNRSFHLNFEVVALLYDERCTGNLAAQFERDLEHSRRVALGEDAARSFPARFLRSAARLVAPFL